MVLHIIHENLHGIARRGDCRILVRCLRGTSVFSTRKTPSVIKGLPIVYNSTHKGLKMGRRHIVVGGGVAGVTCAEELGRLSKDDEVFLVSSDALLKKSRVVDVLSENVEEVDVALESGESAFSHVRNVKSVNGIVSGVDVEDKVLRLASGDTMWYDTLCICTGAAPKRVLDSELVTVLRDTDSIASMNERLRHCTSLMVVGNGGIALDIMYVGLKSCFGIPMY